MLGATVHSASRPTALKKAPAPEQEVLDGYNRGHCVSLPQRVRVCKQLSDERDVLVVEKSGKQVGTWPVRTDMGETSDFEVLSTDFNHDGRAELIVANHDGTSNGMGIDFWSISIFPDASFTTVAEPLTFSVEEYGSYGTFVADRRGVSILTTRWIWTKDPKRKRDVGVYLVGQWWRYRSGELVPLVNRSMLARRYLLSFANERGATSESSRVPYRWLSHPRAEVFKPENIRGTSSGSETGIIEDVSAESHTRSDRTVKLTFRTAGGSTATYAYPGYRNEEQTDSTIDFIGDTSSGVTYPARYFPSQIASWLKGKRATLRTYGDEPHTEKILWLER